MDQNTNTLDPYHRWLGIQPKDQPPNHYRLLGVELSNPTRRSFGTLPSSG